MIKKKKRIYVVLYKYSCYMEFYIKYLEVQVDIFQTEDNNKIWKNDGEDSLLCMNDGDSIDEDFFSVDDYEDDFVFLLDEKEFLSFLDLDFIFFCDVDEFKDILVVDYEDVEMMMLFCFLRNNFFVSLSKDVLIIMKKVFLDCKLL